MAERGAVEAALAGLREGYQADGYDLLVDEVSRDSVKVRIEAGPEACADCLVPKAIAVGTIEASLRRLPDVTRVELVYPGDGSATR